MGISDDAESAITPEGSVGSVSRRPGAVAAPKKDVTRSSKSVNFKEPPDADDSSPTSSPTRPPMPPRTSQGSIVEIIETEDFHEATRKSHGSVPEITEADDVNESVPE